MTADMEDFALTSRRTRRSVVGMGARNIVRMGAILGSVVLAKTTASACPPSVCCFLAGTKIQTAEGERKVEDLEIGELLPTMFGGTRPIQWIGRYSIKKSNPAKPWVENALPVRIARSALAPGVPHSPLYVTAGHSLFIDGLLAPAGMLINGTTIQRCAARECAEMEFFHIKLESHDVIYAEGAPVDTLLHVDESAEETPCVPRASYGGRAELKSRFRSAASLWHDRREKFDLIRDRLEERGIALSRNRQLVDQTQSD